MAWPVHCLKSLETELRLLCIGNKRTSKQKTNKHIDIIMRYMAETGEATTAEIAARLGLSPARTRAILAQIKEIEAVGATNARRYILKQ